ncbi:MAG: hypothetical protein ACPG57_00545, partial [Porticoccaceae bacterium]
LAIENKRRLSHNLKPYTDVDAWELAQEEQEDNNNETPSADNDPMLFETGFILSDQILLLQPRITDAKNIQASSNINKLN